MKREPRLSMNGAVYAIILSRPAISMVLFKYNILLLLQLSHFVVIFCNNGVAFGCRGGRGAAI